LETQNCQVGDFFLQIGIPWDETHQTTGWWKPGEMMIQFVFFWRHLYIFVLLVFLGQEILMEDDATWMKRQVGFQMG